MPPRDPRYRPFRIALWALYFGVIVFALAVVMTSIVHHLRGPHRPQATGALDAETLEILAAAPADFSVLGGDAAYFFPTVLMGGAGAISAAAHLCTERFVAMIECGLAGKVDDGRAHAEALLDVAQKGFSEPNPSVFKGVLHAQGRIPTPDVRLPLLNASDASVQAALAAVARAS